MPGTKRFGRQKPIELTIKDDERSLFHLRLNPSSLSVRLGGEPTYYHLPIEKVVDYIMKTGREIPKK